MDTIGRDKEEKHMKQYKGLYIDHVYFHNKEDIDEFLKKKLSHTSGCFMSSLLISQP